LSGLEALTVRDVLITGAGVTAVLDSPHLAGLKTLALRPGYDAEPLSLDAAGRLRERFGPDVIDDGIPF
jgi:hypothetical protein